jgi:hypothetical protein
MSNVQLRDEAEVVLRSWDAYERNRGSTPIIDYDCYPASPPVEAASSRLEVLRHLETLLATQERDPDETWVRTRLRADIAYLRALLGERPTLRDYISVTQGCQVEGWPAAYVTSRGETARAAVESIGIEWGANTLVDLASRERHLTIEQAPDAIRSAATELEPMVRKLTGTDAPFSLTIESANVDAYWGYWLDGIGPNARLRLNVRTAQFTEVQARVFALHEILGHALKGASYAARCAAADVPWVRLLSVHAPQQVLLEGLAQALPLFVVPDDKPVVLRTQLAHYHQLVMSELHLAINSGVSIEQCALHARSRVPYWTDETIGDVLTDRSVNPQLRSYMWSYSAGIDWFASLAETGGAIAGEVLKAAYRAPLTPTDLEELWPSGPRIGGQNEIEEEA